MNCLLRFILTPAFFETYKFLQLNLKGHIKLINIGDNFVKHTGVEISIDSK